jgi:hypothetical protein
LPEHEPPESYRWPYERLALRQPRCPGCGGLTHAELVDATIKPLYFCISDDCPVFAWDPSVEADDPSGSKQN